MEEERGSVDEEIRSVDEEISSSSLFSNLRKRR